MTICVAGKNDIAVFVLEKLLAMKLGNDEIVVTYNQTETGKNGWSKSLKYYAQRYHIREVQIDDLYKIPDLLFLSMEYDRIIIPARFVSNKLYNIHFSMLPKYKGMYTSAMPLMNGERTSGVTLHKIAPGIDTGDIIDQIEFEITDYDNCRDLYMKHTAYGVQLMDQYLEKLVKRQEDLFAYKQPSSGSTYYSRKALDYSEVEIDLKTTAEMIRRQLRAYTFREYQLPRVMDYPIIDAQITSHQSDCKPGTLVKQTAYMFVIATIDYDTVLYIDSFEELLEACKTGNLEKVKEICKTKRYLSERDMHGWTPLMVATYHNRYEVVKFLLDSGANCHACNNNGTTLLMYAKEVYINCGDRTMFDLFLSLGLDLEVEDYSGKTLKDYCEDNLYNELVKTG